MPSVNLERVMNHLWQRAEAEPSLRFYAVLDAARNEGIYPKLADSGIDFVNLFRGEKARELETVAPYLSPLERDDPFTQWIFNNGWGDSWGILVESLAGLRELKRHFQGFLMVYDEDGKPLYFRYYDPRVLRVYLPTCNGSELAILFGPVDHYWAEGEDGNSLIEYSLARGKLVDRVIPVG